MDSSLEDCMFATGLPATIVNSTAIVEFAFPPDN